MGGLGVGGVGGGGGGERGRGVNNVLKFCNIFFSEGWGVPWPMGEQTVCLLLSWSSFSHLQFLHLGDFHWP